ncbi:MAG: 5-methyltetrahydropteroyltriglutamate--homocysteine S-methyltransferase [Hyphomicrobiales bacterium]
MSERARPPFRADHVGSLLRPSELIAARAAHASGELTRAELRKCEDQAILDVVRAQEDLGLQAVTDGEFRRTSFHLDFLQGFGNVAVTRAQVTARFKTECGEIEMQPPALRVVGKLAHPRGIFVDDFSYLKRVTRAVPKLTIPSPTAMHFRGGRAAIDETAYPDMDEFFADLARVYVEEIEDLARAGCSYLQLDEVNLAYLCDPALRAQVRAMGEDPDTLPSTYAKLINAAIAARPREMSVCLHLCRGNFKSGWVAQGGYEPVADILFNEIAADGYFLEYDTARAGGFEPLRLVPKGKIVVLGLVSSKEPRLETKDDIKRRIDEASRFLPLDQLALSPQCGFASTVEGNAVSTQVQFAKLRLLAEVAREVWS